ncbi:MAG: hypothetical protein RL755_69 [Pseudomonadota bacterium]|jgi:hypothetical protein
MLPHCDSGFFIGIYKMKTLLIAAIALMIATTAQAKPVHKNTQADADFCGYTYNELAEVAVIEGFCGIRGSKALELDRLLSSKHCPQPTNQEMLNIVNAQKAEVQDVARTNPSLCQSEAVKNIIGY